MDIKLFSEIVKELLRSNDKVTLPDFGCFIVEDIPACFSDKGFTINPPYRKVCFRPLREPDTLLVDFYVKTNNTDRARAARVIDGFVKDLRENVYSKKNVVLPGFGRLRATRENNVFFIQDESLNLFPQYDCLESVSLKSLADCAVPVSEPEPQPTPQPEPQLEPESQPTPQPARRRMPLWATAIVIVLSAAIVALAALALAGRLNPDLVDPLLYSPEELEILNYRI